MSPQKVKDNVAFYSGEFEKYKFVKKRDVPEFLGGKLPPSKSLSAFFPRQDGQPAPLDGCINLDEAADRHDWPDDQVDLFLEHNRDSIIKNAQAINFPLERLTLDFD